MGNEIDDISKTIEFKTDYLLSAALYLVRRCQAFLTTHGDISGQTCRFCDSKRTCGVGVAMSVDQLMDAISKFKEVDSDPK